MDKDRRSFDKLSPRLQEVIVLVPMAKVLPAISFCDGRTLTLNGHPIDFRTIKRSSLCFNRSHSRNSCVRCSGINERDTLIQRINSPMESFKSVACGLCAVWALTTACPTFAASSNQRLPPLSNDPNRCERAFVGNTIGQANGVYDKPLDLRFCDFTNEKNNLKGKSLAAALMSDARFDGADMSDVIMSKAYAVGASFKGVDFTNAVVDRVNFEKANMQGAIFNNTVLSGSTFDGANLEGAKFEDTILGYIDLQKLCANQTVPDEGRALLGCK